MRKRSLIIFLLLVLSTTGCVRVDNNSDYVGLLSSIIGSDSTSANMASTGYKYYLPKGVTLNSDIDFNQTFAVDNTMMYMFVDIVSYYYKNDLNNYENDFDYYYQEFVYDGKKGFIGVNTSDDGYFVKIVYNYSKIEFFAREANLSSLVSYAALIISSVEYNDTLIEEFIDDNDVTTNDVIYNMEKPEDSESKFSQYLQEYVQEENTEVVLPDE